MKQDLLTSRYIEIVLFAVWGLSLSSFPALSLVFGYFGGDITIFQPIALKHKLGDVSMMIHLAISTCIMLGPLHRRLLGAVALVLIMIGFMLGLYFGQTVDREIYTPLLPIVGILYSFGLEGIPAFYLLITGYRGEGHRFT